MKKQKTDKMQREKSLLSRRSFASRSALGMAALTLGTQVSGHASSLDRDEDVDEQSRNSRRIGGLEVSPIGLGCMSMTSGSYNPPRSKSEMIPVIRGAVERGVNFFDTAEVYGPFTNEELVGEALAPVRDEVVIGSKFGFGFDNGGRAGRNSKPAHIRQAVEGMLKRLRTDRIDLLYCHRLDREVPVEDIAGTVKDLIEEGKAREFGLSEMSPKTIRKAHAVQPVAALQTQYSLLERFPENEILDTCEELGTAFVSWGPVARGLFGDKFNEYSRFSEDSRHNSVASFRPEALVKNLELLKLIRRWGVRKGASPAQLSLAWLLAQRSFIIPIPGTTKLHHLEEDLGALKISFSEAELKEFREEFSTISLEGVRSFDTALVDQ